jgi:hypothetical protein
MPKVVEPRLDARNTTAGPGYWALIRLADVIEASRKPA